MDALAIQEITGLPYASTTDGQMHACWSLLFRFSLAHRHKIGKPMGVDCQAQFDQIKGFAQESCHSPALPAAFVCRRQGQRANLPLGDQITHKRNKRDVGDVPFSSSTSKRPQYPMYPLPDS